MTVLCIAAAHPMRSYAPEDVSAPRRACFTMSNITPAGQIAPESSELEELVLTPPSTT